ncbi:MAG: FliO/MopB family protein [Myxococcales bacterium FL481]|nr:MAG: FliO/MopB family protein [Myxococcales bacterium FL481]
MRHRALRFLQCLGPLVVAVIATASTDAWAGPLRVELVDEDGQSTVRVLDADGEVPQPEVTSSRRGYMLTFIGEAVEPTRIESKSRRLEYVQAAQYGNRAVVRLAQRPNQRGGIAPNTTLTRQDGGLRLVVLENQPKAPAPAAEPPAPADAADAVAALNDKLGPAPKTQPSGPALAEPDFEGLELEEDAPPVAVAAASPKAAAPSPPDWLAEEPPEAAGGRGQVTDRSTLWAVAGLCAVAMACVPLALWVRRRKGLSWTTQQRLEVLSKTSLGSKQHVVCIRVDQRELLIGVTEHQVRLLADLSHPTSPAVATPMRESVPVPAPAPAPVMTAEPPPPPGPNQVAAADRLDAFKSKLADALVTQGQQAPATSWADKSSGVIELERILSRRDVGGVSSSDPKWASGRESA